MSTWVDLKQQVEDCRTESQWLEDKSLEELFVLLQARYRVRRALAGELERVSSRLADIHAETTGLEISIRTILNEIAEKANAHR